MSNPAVKAYQFANGMVMAFDAGGEQVADYQGPKEEALPKLRRDFPSLHIEGATWHPDGIELNPALDVVGVPDDEAPQPKLTAEQLMAIADEAAAEFEAAFMSAYIAAATKPLVAFKRAMDEGMAPELAGAAFARFCRNIDQVNGRLEAELDRIAKENGIQ